MTRTPTQRTRTRVCDVATHTVWGEHARFTCYGCGCRCCGFCSAIRPWRCLLGRKSKNISRPRRICDACWPQVLTNRYLVTETYYATYFVEATDEEQAEQIVNRLPTGCTTMEREEDVEVEAADPGMEPDRWYTIEDMEEAG